MFISVFEAKFTWALINIISYDIMIKSKIVQRLEGEQC